jgi:hypothetical protein
MDFVNTSGVPSRNASDCLLRWTTTVCNAFGVPSFFILDDVMQASAEDVLNKGVVTIFHVERMGGFIAGRTETNAGITWEILGLVLRQGDISETVDRSRIDIMAKTVPLMIDFSAL